MVSRGTHVRLSLLALSLVLAGCAASVSAPPVRHSSALEAVLSRWDHEDPADLRGVIVLQDGAVVAERYYGGATPTDLNDVRSAGKSVTGLLMQVAIERGLVAETGARVADYWPEAAAAPVGAVPIADLLTMRSGLAAFDDDPASPGNEDRLDESADPARLILNVPSVEAPGRTYNYNSLTASVAGIVVAEATGRPMADFARDVLFTPLGIDHWRWDSDASGYTKGQGNLRLSARDFAALGEMVRSGGLYHGRRLISAAAIDRLLTPQVRIGADDIYADAYGSFWYQKTYSVNGEAIQVHFASGNGGNKLYVIPARRMVVAITSTAYGRGYGQRRSEAILLAVLAGIPGAGLGPEGRRRHRQGEVQNRRETPHLRPAPSPIESGRAPGEA